MSTTATKEEVKKPEAPKKPKVHLETISAEYRFTIEEIGELARKSALESQRIEELENRKKEVTSGFKRDIEASQSVVCSLSNKISCGYEMREVEARVEFDPKTAKKSYYHAKTGAFIRTAEMSKHDYQLSLPAVEEATAKDAKPKAEPVAAAA